MRKSVKTEEMIKNNEKMEQTKNKITKEEKTNKDIAVINTT